MKKLFLLLGLLSFPAMAQNYGPLQLQNNLSDIPNKSIALSNLGGISTSKINVANGVVGLNSNNQISSQTLVDTTLGSYNVHVSGINPFETCPIDACITSTADGGPAYTPFEIQYVTQYDGNWEIGAQISVLDNNGEDSDVAGASLSPGGKMGAYIGLMQAQGAGSGWALNTNITRNAVPYDPAGPNGEPGTGAYGTPGAIGTDISTFGIESDVNNQDQDASSATPLVMNLFINGDSKYPSTAGIFYGGNGYSGVGAYHYGIIWIGSSSNFGSSLDPNGVTMEDRASSAIGYHATGSHATADFYEQTTGAYGLWLTGSKTYSDIQGSSSTPTYIYDNGTHTIGIDESNASEKYTLLAKEGSNICWNGENACMKYDTGTNKFILYYNAQAIFTIDSSGNISAAGTVTQNASMTGLPSQ